jgi:hydrophobic/amphiphilic exporter-1 (mainly G- bacteria), HAE1 family
VIAYLARHPNAANLLMAAIMILGIVSLPSLQRETFPQIASDKVRITVVYPGAASSEVEDSLCRRIETALEGVTNLDEIRCESREGIATATAVMAEGADMPRFLDDIKSEIDAVDDFPELTEVPLVEEMGRTDGVISVAVTGPEDPVSLKAYAEQLKSRMMAIDGIAKVTITGFSDRQIRIEIPATRLRQYGLSASAIADAVVRNSVERPVGRLEGGVEEFLLRVDDRGTTIEALRDLVVVSGSAGASIRLGDIATLSNRFDREENKILFNGQRAALLNVEKTRDQDILNVLGRVKRFVAEESRLAPPGLSLALTQDRATIVGDRLDMLLRNGLQGLALVFLVLWLFFSFRYSFWVSMGLPVSFLGALFLLPLVGISINMISLVGLLIAVGLLMDDAIVIAENIASRMHRGDKAMQAAITGVKEVMPGVLSSFATTILVFGSLAFITGEVGQVLRVVPIVLILVISVSMIEAFLILPSHLAHSLSKQKHPESPSRFRAAFERGFERVRDRVFGPVLDAAIAWRYLTFGIVISLVIVAIAMPASGKIKFVGFPSVDGDIVEARLLLPQGTPLSHTEQLVEHITSALARANQRFTDQPDGQSLVQNVTVMFGENPDAYESGPHVARIIVDLLGAETRATKIDTLRNAWREESGNPTDVISLKFTEPVIGPGGRAIDIRLLGADLDQLKGASLELREWLGSFAGVIDLGDDLRPGKREYRLNLKDGAGVLGIDARTVADQVRAAFQGITVDQFTLGLESHEVDLRLTGDDRDGPEDLANMIIVSPTGAEVPLSVVADIVEARGWARIHRIDAQRAINVQGDVDRDIANAQEIIAIARAEFLPQLIERFPGIRYDVEGESSSSAQTGQSIVRNVLLGMIGVYILLALQFRGYLAPLNVMVVIPTSLIGVVFGHMALGLDLTMPSIVGMASLFGVVVNDSILLVVFIRRARARGDSVLEAARQAGRDRFRPIVLTSITTVAGLLPLLSETSLQAQVLIPLAASLAFGLTSATIAALFLIPAFYCILDDFGALGELDAPRDEPATSA